MAGRRRLRVLMLVHEDLVPPIDLDEVDEKQARACVTEYDVAAGLEQLRHTVEMVGVWGDLTPLRRAVREFEPHVVFNLLEEFHGEVLHDHAMVSYLELLDVAYTGCNPRGLVLARDKALSKKILHYHRVPVPRFHVFQIGRRVRRPRGLEFPLIVKSVQEEASKGISQASVVDDDEKLAERVRLVHERLHTDAIAEEYIEGREVYAALIGNARVEALPLFELRLEGLPEGAVRIATRAVKWDLSYQERHGVRIGPARKLPGDAERRLRAAARRIYRILGLSGYARIDFRVREDGRFYFLEANPNPDLAADEEFASAAQTSGLRYEQLLQRILNLGLRRHQLLRP